MDSLKKFFEWLRDPFGDKLRLQKQEEEFEEITSQVVDIRLARHPYRSVKHEYRNNKYRG